MRRNMKYYSLITIINQISRSGTLHYKPANTKIQALDTILSQLLSTEFSQPTH
jgi:hypothetical protein